MEPVAQLAVILPTLSKLVDEIQPKQLTNTTPCKDFNVEAVLEHMITLCGTFVPAFRGDSSSEVTAVTWPAGAVPKDEFRKAMSDLFDAVTSPGAMERTVSAPFGEVPGSVFARFVAFDGLIHGWDLAEATGQLYELPEQTVAAVDAFAREALVPEMRDGDTFAEKTPVPDDASLLDGLVAFSGRTVRAASLT